MRLYRPVGLQELGLIFDSEMTEFPPRLPEQPIFYPVLNAPYAAQIARDWNTKSPHQAGYVTEFDVDDAYVSRFEHHIVGSRQHEELWVPAEELAEFNRHLQGKIRVIEAYFGEGFAGYVPERFGLAGKNAVEQFVALESLVRYHGGVSFDLWCEIYTNRKAFFLHFPFWAQHSFMPQDIPNEWRYHVLQIIRDIWRDRFPEIALCYADYI